MKNISTTLLFFLTFTAISLSQWITVPSSPSGFLHNIVDVNNSIYLSHSSNGAYKSTDGMVSWQVISNGLNNIQAKQIFEILFYNGDLFAATADGIYKSTDDGNNWEKKSSGITIGPGAIYEFTESIFEYNGNLFTGAFNGLYRSTNNAENWMLTNVTGQHIWAKNFTVHNGILFAAREAGNYPSGFKSFDGGVTWESLPNTPLFSTITFFSEPGKLWSGTIHGVWLSSDDGINWEDRSNGLPPDPYNTCIVRINGKLVTTLKFGGSGIFRSSDEGINWEDFGDELPFLNSIEKIIIYNDKIVAATSGGLWQRDTADVVTQIEEQENSLLSEFKLQQNYPNPFNPSTAINFSVPEPGIVTLKIIDLLGREVETVVDEFKPAGNYNIIFNADNLTNGIYFYRMTSGSNVITRKMVLLR